LWKKNTALKIVNVKALSRVLMNTQTTRKVQVLGLKYHMSIEKADQIQIK